MRALVIVALAHWAMWHPTPNPYPRMVAAAESYWRAPAPCGTPRFVHREAAPAGALVDAWAWVEPDGPVTCKVFLLNLWWRNWAYVNATYRQACRLIVHEYGHLLGFWDIAAPNQIMSYVVSPRVRVPQCDRRASR